MRKVPKTICCDWCGEKGKGIRQTTGAGSPPSWFCSDDCRNMATAAATRLKKANEKGKDQNGRYLCRHCGRVVEHNGNAKWCLDEVCQKARQRYNYGNSRRRARAHGKTLRSTRRGRGKLLAPGEKIGRCPKCGSPTVNRFLCSSCWTNKERGLDTFMAMGGIEISDGIGMVTDRVNPAELEETPVPVEHETSQSVEEI